MFPILPDQTKTTTLLPQKQQLILLKSQAKALARKCRRRRRALDRAYALLILGLVLWAIFINVEAGLSDVLTYFGAGLFMLGVLIFVINIGSGVARQLRETEDKITQLKLEIAGLKHGSNLT